MALKFALIQIILQQFIQLSDVHAVHKRVVHLHGKNGSKPSRPLIIFTPVE